MADVQAVTFGAVDESNFSFPYISCGYFIVLDDKIAFEGNEQFLVELQPLSSALIGEMSVANVTIQDNDSKFRCIVIVVVVVDIIVVM